MSTTPPADEDKSEAEINNTPKIKLEEFLQDGPATGASEPELATKSPKEGYGDTQSTYTLSATNRDMHATSAADGSPTGALEGATENQATKRAMVMRKIHNAHEATINLLVEKLDEMLLQYKGSATMREWLDKLRPLLQILEYTTGSNRARTSIDLAFFLSPKPSQDDVSAALASIVVSLASAKGNAAVLETEEIMILDAFADLCSNREPEAIERSLRTIEGSVLGQALLEEARSELQTMERKLFVTLTKAVKLTGFNQTLTALTKEAIVTSETLVVRKSGVIQLTMLSLIRTLFKEAQGMTSTLQAGLQKTYRNLCHALTNMAPRDPDLTSAFKDVCDTWVDMHAYPGVQLPADLVAPSTLVAAIGEDQTRAYFNLHDTRDRWDVVKAVATKVSRDGDHSTTLAAIVTFTNETEQIKAKTKAEVDAEAAADRKRSGPGNAAAGGGPTPIATALVVSQVGALLAANKKLEADMALLKAQQASAPAKPPPKFRSPGWKNGMNDLFGHGACWKYCGKIQHCNAADKSSDAAFRFATKSCRTDKDGNLACIGPKGDKLTHPRFDKWTVAQQQAAPVPDE